MKCSELAKELSTALSDKDYDEEIIMSANELTDKINKYEEENPNEDDNNMEDEDDNNMEDFKEDYKDMDIKDMKNSMKKSGIIIEVIEK